MRLCTALRPCSAGNASYQCAQRYTSRQYATNDDGSAVQDEGEILKIDQDKKTIETAVGELPLSPIMDPSYWEATRRHQTPKAKPGRPQNSVERQLQANAFAKALATPLRHCAATRIRLPNFFLQDFSLMSHPETGRPWWVPRSLALKKPPAAAAAEEADTSGIEQDLEETELSQTEDATEGLRAEDATAATSSDDGYGKPYGPSAYVLARQDLISSFVVKKSGYENQAKKLFGGSSSRYKPLAAKAVWREDMDVFILSLMRQDIIDDLVYFSKYCTEKDRYYITKCYGWDDIKHKHRGALMWFGEPGQATKLDSAGVQPGPFATFDVTDEISTISLVVHNMPMLLGAEAAEKVKEDAAVLRDGDIFMLAGRRTTDLRLKLWRLQGYLFSRKDTS
ncbi:hypothetical protein F5X99DRAFT_211857 [Biscogniauxia marginata]|nr:hypothetical protein F5X99DRAFT_211857 [Biscogniauxia marginata]